MHNRFKIDNFIGSKDSLKAMLKFLGIQGYPNKNLCIK